MTCAALSFPSALLAQQAPPAEQAPPAQPAPPARQAPAPQLALPAQSPGAPHTTHIHPNRPGRPGGHPNRNPYGYGTVIDGSVIDRFMPTPAPTPKIKPPKAKHTARPANAPDVFEQHSSGGS